MSQFIKDDDQCLKKEEVRESDCNVIEKIISPRSKDLGGFEVKRVLPVSGQRTLGPWVFFDHMGPANFSPGNGINVRPHPHINLATVTYTFEGEILHRDSLGNCLSIKPGELNLMVAGRGIVHSERTSDDLKSSGQKMNGLQLWMALPVGMEEVDPEFLHYDKLELPSVVKDNVQIRVMIGTAYGVTSPVKQFAKTLYIEARMQKGETLTLPMEEERAIYVVKGRLQAGSAKLDTYDMAVTYPEKEVTINALEDDCLVAVIGGEKIGKRYMEWNFVSSRKERIEQAVRDWSDRKFPLVPGDEEEFIPY